MKRHTRITKEGWMYLGVVAFVLSGAVLREINLLLLLAGMLVGIFVWSWAIRRWPKRLTAQRMLPVAARAGDVLPVTWSVESRRRFGTWAIAIEDQVQHASSPNPAPTATLRLFLPYVGAGQSAAASYAVRPMERGRYRFGPRTLSTRFPVGLLVHGIVDPKEETLLVMPALGRLRPPWRRSDPRDAQEAEFRSQKNTRADGDYIGLRDWRGRDGRRRIHWRTSARRNQLVVRQFDRPHRAALAITLDLWQPAEATDADRRRVELAVSFVATLLDEVCRRGETHITLCIEADLPCRVQGAAGPGLLRELMIQLALAQAHVREVGVPVPAAEHAPGDSLTITTRPGGDDEPSPGESRVDSAAAVSSMRRVISVDSSPFRQWFEPPRWLVQSD